MLKSNTSKNFRTEKDIWSSPNENAPFAILVAEDSRSILGGQLLMDVWPKIQDLSVPLVIRRVIADTESGQSLLDQVGLTASRRSPGISLNEVTFTDIYHAISTASSF